MEREVHRDFYGELEARLTDIMGERASELVEGLKAQESEWARGRNDFKRTVNCLMNLAFKAHAIEQYERNSR